MFFCFTFGCPSKFTQANDGTVRICPRCHNASVVGGKKKTWFEFCFIPLFPVSNKNVWLCPVCQWQVDASQGEPQRYGAPPAQPTYGYPTQPKPVFQQQQSGFAQAYPGQRA